MSDILTAGLAGYFLVAAYMAFRLGRVFREKGGESLLEPLFLALLWPLSMALMSGWESKR